MKNDVIQEFKHSTYELKAKGSKQLRNALQYGDIRAISVHFKQPYDKVHGVISGKHAGDKNIIECAERIVAYYERIDLVNSVSEIIESYPIPN